MREYSTKDMSFKDGIITGNANTMKFNRIEKEIGLKSHLTGKTETYVFHGTSKVGKDITGWVYKAKNPENKAGFLRIVVEDSQD